MQVKTQVSPPHIPTVPTTLSPIRAAQGGVSVHGGIVLSLPRTEAEAKAFAAARNREARETREAREIEHKATLRELEAMGREIRNGAPQRSAPRPPAPKPAAVRTTVHRASSPRTPAAHQAPAIDTDALYRSMNERKVDACGSCGAHVDGPAHGLVVDHAPHVPPASAKRAKSFGQIAADYYGGHSADAETPLLSTSARGGGR